MTAPDRLFAVLSKDGNVISTYIGEARARDAFMTDPGAHEVVTYVRERPAPVLPIRLLNPHAIAPRRAHADDAGLDCHALLGMVQGGGHQRPGRLPARAGLHRHRIPDEVPHA